MGEPSTSAAFDGKLTPDAARLERQEVSPSGPLPPVESLVNLTEHDVMLDCQTPPASADEWGSPAPAVISLPPDGRLARVDDDGSRLSEGWLNTVPGLVRLTRLRRSSRVTGLPGAQPGTRYVVPGVTALAARTRQDLVFPHDQVQDVRGPGSRAHGLAGFGRRQALVERFRAAGTA
jgi:hypothetical protein